MWKLEIPSDYLLLRSRYKHSFACRIVNFFVDVLYAMEQPRTRQKYFYFNLKLRSEIKR